MNESDTGVWREYDEKQRKAQMGRRKRYEYFERLPFVHIIRGTSQTIGRVKGKGNGVAHTLERKERGKHSISQ